MYLIQRIIVIFLVLIFCTIFIEAAPCSKCFSSSIEFLNLESVAKSGALKLKESFPHIRFTSGRRTVRDQARAMSQNVVIRRRWIERTYKVTEISISLQKYVDENPKIRTAKALENGFLNVLETFSEEQLNDFSKHLSGQAFDIRPTNKDKVAIREMILTLEGLTKFIEEEGGLVRWHVQF